MEFNLSDKICFDSCAPIDPEHPEWGYIEVEDVKEFIKKLKSELKKLGFDNELGVFETIEELAGEKLCQR